MLHKVHEIRIYVMSNLTNMMQKTNIKKITIKIIINETNKPNPTI